MSTPDEALKFHYGRVQISGPGEWEKFVEAGRGMNDVVADAMTKATADIVFEFIDDTDNAHIGPQHKPGRREHREAKQREWNRRSIKRLGRPAGTYRR